MPPNPPRSLCPSSSVMGVPCGSVIKNPVMQEMQVQSLSQKDSLEKKMATHCSILVENSMNRGAWWSKIYGVTKKSDIT